MLGAYLAWALMAAEVLFVAAGDADMPAFLARSTDRDVPINALLLSTSLSQVVLIITMFSQDAFDFALDLTASLTLIPFLLAALYALKLCLTRETYAGERPATWRADLTIAILATLYTAFLLYAAGPKFVLVSLIFYAPATVLFVLARREQGRRVFTPPEATLFALVAAGAVLGIVALVAGWVTL